MFSEKNREVWLNLLRHGNIVMHDDKFMKHTDREQGIGVFPLRYI